MYMCMYILYYVYYDNILFKTLEMLGFFILKAALNFRYFPYFRLVHLQVSTLVGYTILVALLLLS